MSVDLIEDPKTSRSVRVFGNIDVEIGESLTCLEHDDPKKPEPDAIPEGFHGMFRILTAADGDRRVVWNKYNIQEINEAKKLFRDLIDQGMVPYLVQKGKRSDTPVQKFEDVLHLEEVIFSDVVPEDQKPEVIFRPKRAQVGG